MAGVPPCPVSALGQVAIGLPLLAFMHLSTFCPAAGYAGTQARDLVYRHAVVHLQTDSVNYLCFSGDVCLPA